MTEQFYWLNEESQKFLSNGYLEEGVTAPERIREIADHAEKLLKRDAPAYMQERMEGYADKLYDYIAKGYISLSSPIWANYGNTRGLPVSCFGSHFGDSIPEILSANAEVGQMSKMGGGTSGFFGDIRHRGSAVTGNGKTSGSVHFMELTSKVTEVISQG